MRYLSARYDDYVETYIYRVYTAKMQQNLAEGLGIIQGAKSYIDLIEHKQPDARTGDEIALAVIEAAGLHPKGAE